MSVLMGLRLEGGASMRFVLYISCSVRVRGQTPVRAWRPGRQDGRTSQWSIRAYCRERSKRDVNDVRWSHF